MTRGLRALSRTPGYFALAVSVLALGAASATVMFCVTESVLWRPFAFPDSERLVLVSSVDRKAVSSGAPVSRADFREWRARAHSFTTFAATTYGTPQNIAAPGLGERIITNSVTSNFFELLGTGAALGRGFTPAEEHGARIAILTDAYWRARFDGSPDALGKSIKLDGETYSIAGVLPANFHLQFSKDPDLFLPLDLTDHTPAPSRRELGVIAMLAPGVSAAQALAEMQGIARQTAAPHSAASGDWTVNVENLRTAFNKFSSGRLLLFFGFASLALLVACANVAALQLARYAARSHESALRIALGANRRNLLREALAESAWIAGPGAALGALLAMWGLEALRKSMPPEEFYGSDQIAMDPWTLVFVLGISASTMLFFALAPVLPAGRIDINTALRDFSKGATAGGRSLLRIESFIAAEVALSFLLLFAAGLFVRSHESLLHVPLGFEPAQVAAMRLSPGGAVRQTPAQSLAYYRRMLDAAAAIPGVREAAISGGVPLVYDSSVNLRIPSVDAPASSLARIVTPGYFSVMSIQLLAGRAFNDRDSETAPRVAIVNQRLAAKFFGAESPLGKMLTVTEDRKSAIPGGEVQIVGVAANSKELDLNEIDWNDIYMPFAQNPTRQAFVSVKTRMDARSAIPLLRQALRAVDGEVSISAAGSLEDHIEDGLRGNRFRVFLVGIFAGLAALLAAVGIYGAIAFAVARRSREFGLRMALGARPGAILRLAMSRAGVLTLTGAAFGFAAAFLLGNALRETLYLAPAKHPGILYGIGVHDPASFLAAACATLALAGIAAFVPALRAAAIDPAVTLRQD
jgi:predicted permease